MFQKDMKNAYLLDFYGEVLDEHTRSILRAYYEDDLSLAEIAEDEGISRQGVRHIIKKGEEQLLFLEDKLRTSNFLIPNLPHAKVYFLLLHCSPESNTPRISAAGRAANYRTQRRQAARQIP